MKLLFKIILAVFTLLPITKISFANDDTLIVWNRGGWGEWVVEGFNKKMEAEGRALRATSTLNPEFVLKFNAAMSSGERIDIVAMGTNDLPNYAAMGALTDITDFVTGFDYFDNLNPIHLKQGTLDGRYYAIPNAADVSGFVYNKKLMPTPPKDWAEMLSMCKDFAAKDQIMIAWPTKNPGGMRFTGLPMAWANGGSYTSDDGKTAQFNHPKNIEWIMHYKDLYDAGCVPENVSVWDWGDKQDGFLAGDIAMIGTGNFLMNVVKDHTEKVDAGFTPFMSKDGSMTSSYVGGDGISIPVTVGNMEGAKEYLQYALSPEVQIEIYSKNGGLPVRSDLVDNNPYLTEDSKMFLVESRRGYAPYLRPYHEISEVIVTAFQRVLAGEDAQGVFDEANDKFQAILDAAN